MTENSKKLLYELAKDIYTVTKMQLAIYDSDKNLIVAYPDKCCAFCEIIWHKANLGNRCIGHDNIAFEVCEKTLKSYKYKCHMGITEVSTPIVKDGLVLGYLHFGQITEDKANQSCIEAIEKLNVSPELKAELYEALPSLKYRKSEYIKSISRMMEANAAYILLNDYVSVRTGSLAFSISKFIKSNLSLDLSSGSICKQFNISRRTLCNISDRFYNMGINEYVASQRINAAKILLSKGGLTIYQIAERVGIPDANYFTKVFKKHTGLTPSRYIKD